MTEQLRIFCSYDTSNPKVWRLEQPYVRKTSLGEVLVPSGFQWDGASVPQRLRDVLPPWGAYSGAALVHDWLYSAKPCRREQADRVFHELMLEDDVPAYRAWLMWRAVRVFGSGPWRRSQRDIMKS